MLKLKDRLEIVCFLVYNDKDKWNIVWEMVKWIFLKTKKKKEEINKLIDYEGNDGCMATNMITVEGWKVGYMYRDEPSAVFPDSGWRFDSVK